MNLGTESQASRRDNVIFGVCVLLSIIARVVPQDVGQSVASVLRESALRPLIVLQHQSERLRQRRTDFQVLLAQRDSSLAVAAQLPRIESENERLRRLLELRQRLRGRHVAADVLQQVQQAALTTFLISVGETQGVQPLAPVVVAEGLVGSVQEVDGETATVYTWSHPDFRASATTEDGSITGIVAAHTGGSGNAFLELREVASRTDIAPGTLVITSGHGGVYPRGLPVGRIRQVIEEQVGLSKTYLIEPAVPLAAVSHVLVLLDAADDAGDALQPPPP